MPDKPGRAPGPDMAAAPRDLCASAPEDGGGPERAAGVAAGRLSRRELLRTTAALGLGCAGLGALELICPRRAEAGSPLRMKEALFYDKLSGGRIQCKVCPRQCKVGDRERGFCGSRENRQGKYYTLVYGSAAALNIDPIEKKPLFHFLPGSRAFSLGTAGCNFDCKDCQNWELSQARPEQVDSQELPPAKVAGMAKQYGCQVIAYTYTEPVTFLEYMIDTAREGHRVGLRSVMITNGYINRDPLLSAAQHLDAIRIDWKGPTEAFYNKYCAGTLQPVIDTIGRVKRLGKWLELVYLVVPTLNDSPGAIRQVARWIKTYLGADTPLHFSRFVPQYQLKNLPPTSTATLERCHDVAREQGLNFVYLGNVPGHKYESTYCPKCGAVVIERWGFEVRQNRLTAGRCPQCGRTIPGVWR